MKKLLLFLAAFRVFAASAEIEDSLTAYQLPDTVKAVAFYAEIKLDQLDKRARFTSGIQANAIGLNLQSRKGKGKIRFTYPAGTEVIVRGNNVALWKNEALEYSIRWKTGETYKVMIAMAGDSAGNFSLYSGYVWLAAEQKWKLVGTCKVSGQWKTLEDLKSMPGDPAKTGAGVLINNVWCQRSNGTWKKLNTIEEKPPVINLFGHADSVARHKEEIQQIEATIAAGSNQAKLVSEGVYYEILKEGTGSVVTVNDTVTVHYKGSLFADGQVFDQTKEKPASFPLKRLIRGWQIGIPLCRVGGKIRLVIPSALAYSARTRAAKIPPNSILVFEIEVLDTKPGH